MKYPKIVFLLASLTIIFTVFGFWFKKNNQNVVPTPVTPWSGTPTNRPRPEKITKVDSGDGKISLILSTKQTSDDAIDNVFKVSDNSKNQEWPLFEKTTTPATSISIPINAWTPDDKQLFFIENGPETHYYVFKADGASFKNGDKFLDVANFWAKSKNNYAIKNVTGWASGDLLIVETLKPDGTTGPWFWFVTSSRKFLQLRPGP